MNKEKVDFPILRHVDNYILAGGRIERRRGRVCLVDKDGEYIISGETTQEMLESLIFLIC